jgi:hypothetical protein
MNTQNVPSWVQMTTNTLGGKPMARANTPLDPLEPITDLEEGNSIPVRNRPWFSVGQIVKGVEWEHSSNERYYLRKLLKASKKRTTREILDLLNRGESIELSIAGIEACYAIPTIFICNQCYLQNGGSHGGLTWQYKVLIKGVLDGNSVCVIPKVWISEGDFIPLTEIEFKAKQYYKDDRNHIYKCVFPKGELAFVYVGHIRKDGKLSWDNHITPRKLSHWMRRRFQPYTLPDRIFS